jgi:hypothetical protein
MRIFGSYIKAGDTIIIFIVIIVIGLLSYKFYFYPTSIRKVAVSIDGKIVQTFSNEDLSVNDIYSIALKNGTAEIEINQGRVRILPMSKELCPRGICSRIGWIKNPKAEIVCVPNRLIVQVLGERNTRGIDAVVR